MGLFTPAEVAKNYITTGKGKAAMPSSKLFLLGMMAGAFIALAGVGASTASAMVGNASLAKLISGLVFPGGLMMVLLAGSELFTGNCLMVISLLEREIRAGQMLSIGNLPKNPAGNSARVFLDGLSQIAYDIGAVFPEKHKILWPDPLSGPTRQPPRDRAGRHRGGAFHDHDQHPQAGRARGAL